MKHVKSLILAVFGAALMGCGGSSDKPADQAQATVERAAAKRVIEGYFGDKAGARTHGAFFLVVEPKSEATLRGFMAGHRPRVELGTEDLLVEAAERPVLRDRVTGLPAIRVRLWVEHATDQEAVVKASTEGPGRASYTFHLRRTAPGWIISRESIIAPWTSPDVELTMR